MTTTLPTITRIVHTTQAGSPHPSHMRYHLVRKGGDWELVESWNEWTPNGPRRKYSTHLSMGPVSSDEAFAAFDQWAR